MGGGYSMKGLVVWAQSNCRSTMAFYRGLARCFNVPLLVCLRDTSNGVSVTGARVGVGFRADEFKGMEIVLVGDDYLKGCQILSTHGGWHHLFAAYQSSPVYRRLLLKVKAVGGKIAVGSESPCNMSFGWRRMVKDCYLKTLVPIKVKDVICAADFFINYSGNDASMAQAIGWPIEKIIPFGYFPPPLEGAKCIRRTTNRPFHILATGVMTRYRGVDVLVDALVELRRRGIPFSATITQQGELYEMVKRRVKLYDLPVNLTGFIPMNQLIELYQSCTVYVGSGRSEPWGMRLNDALQCGAPLVVSRGMGGVSLIDGYRCGLAFSGAGQLADCLERLALDESFYLHCADNAVKAAASTSPDVKASWVVQEIRNKFSGWE